MGSVTVSVSRPATNRKSEKIRPASRALVNFLSGTDGYCSMAGIAFSLSPYFLISNINHRSKADYSAEQLHQVIHFFLLFMTTEKRIYLT